MASEGRAGHCRIAGHGNQPYFIVKGLQESQHQLLVEKMTLAMLNAELLRKSKPEPSGTHQPGQGQSVISLLSHFLRFALEISMNVGSWVKREASKLKHFS